MKNRRSFLQQTTLAAGAFAFLKPLKTFALSPGSSSAIAGKLSILHLNNLETWSKLPANSLSFSFRDFSNSINNKNSNTLLLGTGNIFGDESESEENHVEKFTRLKKAGCDAVVPGYKDLEKGSEYYNELAAKCKLKSLGEAIDANGNSDIFSYHIVQKGKIKAGIIGNDLLHDNPTTISVENVAAKLNKTAKFLKETHHCHLIVSMNPYNNNGKKVCNKSAEKKLAAMTKHIDVILSSNYTSTRPATFVLRNAIKNEVVLQYQDMESSALKGLDISFNNNMEKAGFSLRKFA